MRASLRTLSFIEADRADRMVEQRLQLRFVRESGRFHIVVPFVRGCVTGVGKATVQKAARRGRNVRGGASRLPDRPVPETAERTEQDDEGR
jgi:hypothetical protein